MENTGADKMSVSAGNEAECSETMVEIKIKTLDSQIYTLRVNKCMPVPALKEQIATVTGVLSEQQRLICRGKVLKDDQLLSAYHVEDGHTLHLVVRQPFHPSPMATAGPENSADNSADRSNSGRNRGSHVAHSVVLGTFNIGDQGDGASSDINQIVSAVLSSIGISNMGSGSLGLRELRTERVYGASGANGTSSMQPPLEQSAPRAQSDSVHNAFQSPSSVSLGSIPPAVIPDSLTTLSQYLMHLRHEFSTIGRSQSGDVGVHGMEGRDHGVASGSSQGLPTPASLAEVMQSTRQMLIEHAGGCLSLLASQLENHSSVADPPARMAIQSNAMRSGVLLQNLGALLLELGRTIMTLRMGQTPAEAVVNAGPSVFISTSGPNPIMVQPLPFQPGSSFGAIPSGTATVGHGLGGGILGSGSGSGSGLLPRNIDIRIRTGPSVSAANASQSERAGAQQPPGQLDSANSTGVNLAHQPVSGASGGSSFTGESRVRVVPVRTVVAAVPAALTRPPSDSAGNAVGLFYPLVARFQHLSSGNAHDTRGFQVSAENQQSNPETTQPNAVTHVESSRREGNDQSVDLSPTNGQPVSVDVTPPLTQNQQGSNSNPNSGLQEPSYPNNQNNTLSGDRPINGQDSTAQIPSRFDQLLRTIFSGEHLNFSEINIQTRPAGPVMEQTEGSRRDSDANEASRADVDPGMFFSGLVRQIMPFLSQSTPGESSDGSPGRVDAANRSTDPDSSALRMEQEEDISGVESSRRCGDLPEPPSSKRQKRD